MQLFLSVLLVSSMASLGFASDDIVYGEDNRVDVVLMQDAKIQTISQAVAARVTNFSINNFDPKMFSFDRVPNLSYSMGVCSDEKFADQPTVADCTGFLVGDDLLATAGHCIAKVNTPIVDTVAGSCATHSWMFDYKVKEDGSIDLASNKRNNLYSCKKVVYSVVMGDVDFAIIQLDRKVVGRTPLKLSNSGQIKKDTPVFVVGHPSGLPQKYADGAKVFSHEGNFFRTNLDTFGGNSGSPVFNMNTYEVEGILVRGAADYVAGTFNGRRCARVNICDNTIENCSDRQTSVAKSGEHVTIIQKIKKFL